MMKISAIVVILNVVIRSGKSSCEDDQWWMRKSSLDSSGKLTLKWNFTETEFTFLVIGETHGWMAIGFSPSGDVNGTDYVVGWVKNGTVKLQDRYSTNDSEPQIDAVQSLTLIGGTEEANRTRICFQRNINSCDQQDQSIPRYNIYILWAYSKDDPLASSYGNLQFEKATKGRKHLRLLTKWYPKPSLKDLKTFDVVANNISLIPNSGRTLYWCLHRKMSPSEAQRYLVGWEPVIQESNEGNVHHSQLYICSSEVFDKIYDEIDPNGYDCLDLNMTKYQNLCVELLLGWALGGENQFYPPDVSIALGDKISSPIYFKLEQHYDIPSNKIGAKDHSGIRLFYTNQKPKYEGGFMALGVRLSPFQLIPPGKKAFSTIGLCDPNCLKKKLPSEGIKVFSLYFHAHLAGRQIFIHRFRNGKELEPVQELHFDSRFQGAFFQDKELHFLPDDLYAVECVYDTSKRNYTTTMNFPTSSEMCTVFFAYYPHVNLTWCHSMLKPQEIYNLTGIEEVGPIFRAPGVDKCQNPPCSIPEAEWGAATGAAIITKPETFANMTLANYMMAFNDWTPAKEETIKKMNYGDQIAVCKDDRGTFDSTENDLVRYPENITPFVSPDLCKKPE